MGIKNLGSGIDEFMKKENAFEGAQTQAINEVTAWKASRAGTEAGRFKEHPQRPERTHGGKPDLVARSKKRYPRA